jgi:hypothetical protein
MSGVVQREWWKTGVKSCCRPLTWPSPVSGSTRLGSFRQVSSVHFVPAVRACDGFDHVLWLRLAVPATFCLWGADADTSEDDLHMLGARLSRGDGSKLILGHAGDYRCGCHVNVACCEDGVLASM